MGQSHTTLRIRSQAILDDFDTVTKQEECEHCDLCSSHCSDPDSLQLGPCCAPRARSRPDPKAVFKLDGVL